MKKSIIWLCLLLMLIPMLPAQAAIEYQWMYDDNNGKITIPKAYGLKGSYAIFGDGEILLKDPKDLFVAVNDHLFIADSGNHRIVELDENMEYVRSYDNAKGGKMKSPEGIFVDENLSLYVADTGNARILHLAPDGSLIEVFETPTSDLLGSDFVYTPRKIAVSDVGYLYTLKYQYVMQIDAYNRFRGYIGTSQVGFDLMYKLRYMLSNAEQRKAMASLEPDSCYSFDIGPDGTVYITTLDENGQLKRINSIGVNIYPRKGRFAHPVVDNVTGESAQRQYIDLDVTRDGNVVLLENLTGYISVWDSLGNNLCEFGGKGAGLEYFQTPIAVESDSRHNIYVLDAKSGGVKVFEPMRFQQLVYSAVGHYAKGEYDEAKVYWQQILDVYENYPLANIGMAKLAYKEKDYKTAYEYYKVADDKDGYSQAFVKYRMAFYRENFTLVVIAIVAIGGALIGLVVLLKRFTRKNLDRYRNVI